MLCLPCLISVFLACDASHLTTVVLTSFDKRPSSPAFLFDEAQGFGSCMLSSLTSKAAE